MKRFLSVLLLVCSLLIAGQAGAALYPLYATQDANIVAAPFSGTPFFPSNGYITQYWDDGNGPVANAGLMQFDLTGFSSSVSGMYLNLFQDSALPTGTATLALYRLTSGWNNYDVTWDTRPAWNAAAVASMTINDDPIGSGVWRSFNITALVNDWIANPGNNFGIMLARTDSAEGIFFQSITNGDGSFNVNGPNLTPTPVPPSLLLLVPGLVGLVGLRKRFGK